MKPAIAVFVPVVLCCTVALADPPWLTIIDRDGTDGGHLTVQLNSVVTYYYIVYPAPQSGGSGFVADLEPGDIFIEWDEDPGHGSSHYFDFTGQCVAETPDYIMVDGPPPTNWVVYTVITSGTLTKTDDCCNEHDAVHLSFSPLYITKTDDVNNDAGVVPGDEVTYTICYDYPDEPNLPDINDINIVDYLPLAVGYVASNPSGTYDSQMRIVKWQLGTIRPGDNNCVTLTVSIKECFEDCGSIRNYCEIKSNNQAIANAEEYTPLYVATNPSPAFGEVASVYVGQSQDVNLTWCPGNLAADFNGHDVYFGTDFVTVKNAGPNDTGIYKGRQSSTVYTAENILTENTYYWRIDEVNLPFIWQGPVWAFSTGLFIDDFQHYNSIEELETFWQVNVPPGTCSGDAGSGQVSLITEENDKYMMFAYDKSGGTIQDPRLYFSEVMLTFDPDGADWLDGDMDGSDSRLLVISFKGDIGNSTDPVYDRMYIAVEDTDGDVNIALNPDPNAQAADYWQDWIIPLSDLNSPDVNLEAVRYFSIGFGQRCLPFSFGGADGNVIFDDIRIQSPCSQQYAPFADLNNDCVVDFYDVEVMSEQWLICGICGMKADIYPALPDAIIDFRDFALLAAEWLQE